MNKYWLKLSVLVLAIAVSSLGCGGGSSGTGIQGSSYQGVLTDSSGTPLAGVTLTVQETGETVTTDGEGMFSLPLDPSVPTNTIFVQGLSSDFQIQVPTAPTSNVAGGNSSGGDSSPADLSTSIIVSGAVT